MPIREDLLVPYDFLELFMQKSTVEEISVTLRRKFEFKADGMFTISSNTEMTAASGTPYKFSANGISRLTPNFHSKKDISQGMGMEFFANYADSRYKDSIPIILNSFFGTVSDLFMALRIDFEAKTEQALEKNNFTVLDGLGSGDRLLAILLLTQTIKKIGTSATLEQMSHLYEGWVQHIKNTLGKPTQNNEPTYSGKSNTGSIMEYVFTPTKDRKLKEDFPLYLSHQRLQETLLATCEYLNLCL